METKLIRLRDGTLIEVEVRPGDTQVGAIEHVQQSLDTIRPVLLRVAQSVGTLWQEMSQDLTIESAEIGFGLSFESEGSIFVTKASASANLSITLTITPRR